MKIDLIIVALKEIKKLRPELNIVSGTLYFNGDQETKKIKKLILEFPEGVSSLEDVILSQEDQ